MQRRLFLLLLLPACVPPAQRQLENFLTPASPDPVLGAPLPLSASYELLDLVTGQACEKLENLPLPYGNTDLVVPGTGHPLLYQAAKYDALSKAQNADNLLSIRVKVDETDIEQCVTLTGRAYRITGIETQTGTSGPRVLLESSTSLFSGVDVPITSPKTRKMAAPRERTGRIMAIGGPILGGDDFAVGVDWGRQGTYLGLDLIAHTGDSYLGGPCILGGLSPSIPLGGESSLYFGFRAGVAVDGGYMANEIGIGTDIPIGRLAFRAETGALGSDLFSSVGGYVRLGVGLAY